MESVRIQGLSSAVSLFSVAELRCVTVPAPTWGAPDPSHPNHHRDKASNLKLQCVHCGSGSLAAGVPGCYTRKDRQCQAWFRL